MKSFKQGGKVIRFSFKKVTLAAEWKKMDAVSPVRGLLQRLKKKKSRKEMLILLTRWLQYHRERVRTLGSSRR